MKTKRVRPAEMPVGTDIKGYVQNLVEKEVELHYEIEEMQFKLREMKAKKRECEALMVEAFIETKMYWMFRINRTELRRYLVETDGGIDS